MEMPMAHPKRRAALAAASVSAALTLAAPAAAEAPAEDPRATQHDGNATTCEGVGLAGELLAWWEDDKNVDALEFEGGRPESDQALTITEVLVDDVEVTGIVVKGGPRHNVYVPGESGLPATPAWKNLTAPLNRGGAVPEISHWFVCAVADEPSDEPTETPTATTTTPPVETSPAETTTPAKQSPTTTEPTETTTSPAAESSAPVTTSQQPASAIEKASAGGDLAETGVSAGWLVWIGSLLVLGGVLTLALLRMRPQD
jgi:hypothetical protein